MRVSLCTEWLFTPSELLRTSAISGNEFKESSDREGVYNIYGQTTRDGTVFFCDYNNFKVKRVAEFKTTDKSIKTVVTFHKTDRPWRPCNLCIAKDWRRLYVAERDSSKYVLFLFCFSSVSSPSLNNI